MTLLLVMIYLLRTLSDNSIALSPKILKIELLQWATQLLLLLQLTEAISLVVEQMTMMHTINRAKIGKGLDQQQQTMCFNHEAELLILF